MGDDLVFVFVLEHAIGSRRKRNTTRMMRGKRAAADHGEIIALPTTGAPRRAGTTRATASLSLTREGSLYLELSPRDTCITIIPLRFRSFIHEGGEREGERLGPPSRRKLILMPYLQRCAWGQGGERLPTFIMWIPQTITAHVPPPSLPQRGCTFSRDYGEEALGVPRPDGGCAWASDSTIYDENVCGVRTAVGTEREFSPSPPRRFLMEYFKGSLPTCRCFERTWRWVGKRQQLERSPWFIQKTDHGRIYLSNHEKKKTPMQDGHRSNVAEVAML